MSQNLRKVVVLGMVVLFLTGMATALAQSDQGNHRKTSELEKDLKATKGEFKAFNSLVRKLESSASQSSNAARDKATENLQDFMGECIGRREKDLGTEMTIKQHGETVKTGTTDVAHVGSPVPSNKSGKGKGLEGTSNENRMRQLSQMKSLYVAAKNNRRPAIEKQGDAFSRYSETIKKFGDQIQWGITDLTNRRGW